MQADRKKPKTIDEYIAAAPKDVRGVLAKIRTTVRRAAPDAEETIQYQMPTFTLQGALVHFAAHTSHIGFYPTPSGIEKFQKELSRFKTAKGSAQFPLDEPMPYALIESIVKFRVRENVERAAAKKKR